jgi:sugar lactone lactonase YvrE
MYQRNVRITRARVEVLFALKKKDAHPNGLDYDQAKDQLLVIDQADGGLIAIDDPRGTPRESLFAAGANKPSGLVRCTWQGRETLFIAGTYGRELTVVQEGKVFAIDHTGIGTGIVDFAQDRVKGTHTGYHGLEWDGQHLWAASPPAKAIFRLKLEQTPAGPAIASCSWFPVAFGNRPHGLAWADAGQTQLWCNDTTLAAVYRYDVATGACLEILALPPDAPESHGMTMVDGRLWYCEDRTARVCEIIPLR